MIISRKQASIFTVTLFTLTLSITSPAYATPAEYTGHEQEPPKQILATKHVSTTINIEEEKFETEILPPPAQTTALFIPTGTPALSGYSNLLDAARAQLGISQDCTAMVENALRAIGYTVGDLAPMGFSQYGTPIQPQDAQAGDIMMRNGHVAIYAGGGVAIHGGFNGNTVQTTFDANPANYTTIVRI